jgi:transposase InsO family protein
MAVTRDGIPVRCWCWPGNASDQKLIRQVKDDMRDWTLSKIVWVTDRGFSSEANRRYLRQGDHAYIIGEKLRSGSPEVKAALSRQGRYTEIAENMRVKEVRISDTDHGAQYGSRVFARLCDQLGVTRSMGAVGTSAGNAACESFHASLKRETLQGRRTWSSEREARLDAFRWLHRYNTRRRHSRLGQRSPIAYETALDTTSTNVAPAA